jgi:hypothetical protein
MPTYPTTVPSTLPPLRGVVRGAMSLRLAILVMTVLVGGTTKAADTSVTVVPRVAAGVVVADPTAPRWNRVIYLAVARITHGDAASVPENVRSRVQRFTLALMATVTNANGPDAPPSYQLVEVGAGYAVPLGGRLTVISTENPPSQAGIDYLGRQVLAANGRNLGEVRRKGMSSTAQVVDVDVLFRHRGRHTPLVMRHFIWVEPRSGRCTCCVWLLARQQRGGFTVAGFPPRWLQEGTRDTRAIHVDDDEFFLGMPTREAFALTSLPPGLDLSWTPALRELAALATLSEADLKKLTVAVDEALEPLRKPAN